MAPHCERKRTMARLRTFAAVEIDAGTRSAAVALQRDLAKCGAAVKWVETQNLHVTLVFLGEVEDRELPAVCKAIGKVAAKEPPFRLGIAGVGAFPNPRRPKTVWSGISDGTAELVRLHDGIETALEDLGAYRREERAFTPHLTLGRPADDDASQLIAAELPRFAEWQGGGSVADEVVLFSSEMRKSGPEYAVLARFPLQ